MILFLKYLSNRNDTALCFQAGHLEDKPAGPCFLLNPESLAFLFQDAMRAANILKGFDSSKHSGVIVFFNQTFLKDGELDKNLSKIIKDTSYLREKSDYDHFFIASKEDAEIQLRNAGHFVTAIETYLNVR